MAANALKGITVVINGDVTELTSELKKVDAATSEVGRALSEVEKGLKFSPDNVTLLGQKQEYAARQAENLSGRVETLTEALSQVSRGSEAFNKIQREIVAAQGKMARMEATASEAKASIDRINAGNIETIAQAAEEARRSGEGLAGTLAQVASGAAMAVGSDLLDAAKGAAAAALETAQAWDTVDARISAAAGSTKGYAEEMSSALRGLYADGWGESIEGLTETAIKAREVLGELDEQDLSTVIKSVETMESVFGSDVTESLRGVNVLMEKFGLTATQACDLMMSGMQRGLDYTDELGDNLSEYAGRWAEAGLSATEYFSMLQAGVDAGAYNLDKVGDYLNEFLTSLSDGRMADSIGNFSSQTQAVWESYQAGGATAKDVLDAVVGELRDCESQTEALTLASDTWSSLGEDNALGVITALADVQDSYTDTAGAADAASQALEESSEQTLESFKRQAMSVVEPLAGVALDALTAVLSEVQPAVEAFNGLDETTKKVVLSVVAMAALFPKVSTAVQAGREQVVAIRSAMATARLAADELAASEKAAGASAKTMGAQAKTSATGIGTAARAAKSLKSALSGIGTGLALGVALTFVESIGNALEENARKAEEARKRADDLATVAGGVSEALDKVDSSSLAATAGAADGASSSMAAAATSADVLSERVATVSQAAQGALATTAEGIRTAADGIAGLDARASQAQGFVDTIERLRDTEGLTEEQQRELSDAVEGFNTVTGASISVVDAHNGVLDASADSINAICDAYVREAQCAYYADELAGLYDQQAEQIGIVEEATDALADSVLAYWQSAFGDEAIDKVASSLGKTREELAQTAAQSRLTFDSLTGSMVGTTVTVQSITNASDGAAAAMGVAWGAAADAQAALDGTNSAISDLNGRMEEAAGATGDAGQSLDELTGDADEAAEAVAALTDASEASVQGLRASADTVEEAVALLGGLADGSRDAGDAIEDAFRGAMGDGKTVAELTDEVNSALKDAGAITDDLTEREVLLGYATGKTGAEMVEYARAIQEAKDAQEEQKKAAEEAEKVYDELLDSLRGLAEGDTGLSRWLGESGHTVESFASELQGAGVTFSQFESDYSSMVETLRNGNDLIRDSWENVPSAEEYAANLYQNNIDYLNWQSSLLSLTDYVATWADDSAREMGDQFISALTDMGPEYAPLVEDFIANPEAFGNAAWEWSQSGKHVMESAAEGMAEGASEVEQAAADAAGQATDSLAQGVEEGSSGVADSAAVLGDATMDALMGLPAEMEARGEAAGGYLGVGLGSSAAQGLMADGVAALSSSAADALIDLSEEMRDRGEYAGGMFALGMADATATGDGISTAVAESLASFAENMYLAAQAGGESFADGLLEGGEAASSNGRALADAACEGAEPGEANMARLGKAAGEAYAGKVSSATSVAAAGARALLQAVYGGVSDGNSGMSARGQAAGGSYAQGILYGYTTAYSNAKALAAGAVEAMKAYESSAFAAGQSLGESFASGLSSAASATTTSARARVSSAVLDLSNLGSM